MPHKLLICADTKSNKIRPPLLKCAAENYRLHAIRDNGLTL